MGINLIGKIHFQYTGMSAQTNCTHHNIIVRLWCSMSNNFSAYKTLITRVFYLTPVIKNVMIKTYSYWLSLSQNNNNLTPSCYRIWDIPLRVTSSVSFWSLILQVLCSTRYVILKIIFFSGCNEHGWEDSVSSRREDDRSSGQRGKLSDTSKPG